jgi:hypothetical protein
MEKLKSLDRDQILEMLGLEVKRGPTDYILPAVTLFGVGLLVGAGVGLLFAPRPGRELREDLANRLQQAPEALSKLPQRASELGQKAGEAAQRIGEQARDMAGRAGIGGGGDQAGGGGGKGQGQGQGQIG